MASCRKPGEDKGEKTLTTGSTDLRSMDDYVAALLSSPAPVLRLPLQGDPVAHAEISACDTEACKREEVESSVIDVDAYVSESPPSWHMKDEVWTSALIQPKKRGRG